MTHSLIRSALFVPGNRPERFAKALASGADAVIIDLEDAVAPADKAMARKHLTEFIMWQRDVRLLVRINAADTAEHQADLDLCRQHPDVAAIMLPKTESAAQVDHVARSGKPVWPIIESAQGMLSVAEIAACAGVQGLTFGALDLALDLGMKAGGSAADRIFDQIRFALLLHSRVNGLQSPLDSVYPAFTDDSGLTHAMLRGRDMGMAGALCIHPRQVSVVHAVLAPSAEELAWAQRVLQAAECGDAALKVDGEMVDAPVIGRARRLLAFETVRTAI
ncbi:Citrate lyase subunit beta-like protein [Pseudomonas sp. IT-P74]|uniref:HpcH/HpaI aldolase/citrate lyase family protein n=1 Tax=Pseudomonas sp. IT-P74 TaxID=3026445 RepID=UPI0039DF564B